MKAMYLATDGDDVGHRLEYFMLMNDRDSLANFSAIFASAMTWLESKLVHDFQATIIFTGGDNLLATISASSFSNDALEKLRLEFVERAHSTLSIGLGETLREAYFALKLAKTSGKNCVRQFGEFVNE